MMPGYIVGAPQWACGGKETLATVHLGDIFVLEESGTNSDFYGVRGKVVAIARSTVTWKPIDAFPCRSCYDGTYNININRFIRVGSATAGSATAGSHNTIIGWFPKKPWLNEDISDVDWNPYE